jgi:hypothetical protein
MSCQRCEELHQRFEITTPGELAKAIRVVQSNLHDGTLVQAKRAGGEASTPPFSSIRESGPWDDVLLYEFLCRSCGARFQLSAETYHGEGGEWQPIGLSTG